MCELWGRASLPHEKTPAHHTQKTAPHKGPDLGDFITGKDLAGTSYSVEAPSWKVRSVCAFLVVVRAAAAARARLRTASPAT